MQSFAVTHTMLVPVLLLALAISCHQAILGLMRLKRKAGKTQDRRYFASIEMMESFAPLIELCRPFAPLTLTRLSTKNIRHMETLLNNAGLGLLITLEDFVSLRLAMGLSGGVVGGLFGFFRFGASVQMISYVLLPLIVGWIYPSIWLEQRSQDYQLRIFRGLSDTLDILSVSIHAGLDLRSALERVVQIGSEPDLDYELRRTLEEIDKGGKTTAQAFESLSQRINLPEMTSFVNVLLMAFSHGGDNLAQILVDQAQTMRNERILRAENYVNKVPSKILIPIVVFILPAVLLTLLGPILLEAFLTYGA